MKTWIYTLALCGLTSIAFANDEDKETEQETAQVEVQEEQLLSAADGEEIAENEVEKKDKCELQLMANAGEEVASDETTKEVKEATQLNAWPKIRELFV